MLNSMMVLGPYLCDAFNVPLRKKLRTVRSDKKRPRKISLFAEYFFHLFSGYV